MPGFARWVSTPTRTRSIGFSPGKRILAICQRSEYATPLPVNRDPDLAFVESTARQLAQTLHPRQLIILESTSYPGTTRQVVLPILQATGLRVGTDFFLAFGPEREDPGNALFSGANVP